MAEKENKELHDEQLDQVSGGSDFKEWRCPNCKSTDVGYYTDYTLAEYFKCRLCGHKWKRY